jgi:DHA1 family multidrug resistance protein-like MFS transporter
MIQRLLRPIRSIPGGQRTLYIMVAAQLVAGIGLSNMFPFLPLYVQALGTKTSLSLEFWAGMVYSAQAMTMMIASPIWGAVADRYGRKLMVQRAMFGGAVIMLLMAFARSAEDLVLLRAIQGLVTGVISAASALVAAVAPREKTGYAMGLLQVGFWGGLAIGPITGGILADALGYRNTFIVTVPLLAAAGVLVGVGVKETFVPPAKSERRRPGILANWRRVLGTQGVLPTYAFRFLGSLAGTMIVPIIPLLTSALLPDAARVNTFTGLMTGLASAASTATAVYLGRLGDRIGHRRVLLASTLAAGLFYLLQSLVTEAWQLLVLQVLAGAASGGMIPALSALLAGYTRPGEEGSVYGLDNSIRAASRAVAPLTGAGIAQWFGFRATLVTTGLTYLVVTVLAAWRLPETRNSCTE